MPSQPIQATSTWWCPACDPTKEMTYAEAMEHLRSVHKLDTKGLKAKKAMTEHLDCADSYHFTFEWTIPVVEGVNPEIKLVNSTTNPRKKHPRS